MRQFSRLATVVSTVALAGALAACAGPQNHPAPSNYQGQVQQTYPQQAYPATSSAPMGMEYGTVANIEALQTDRRTSGAGAVLGAVVGGVLGNTIGGGSGRAAATVLGAVGGAAAGNAVENNRNGGTRTEGYRLTVNLDRGGQRMYDVPTPGDLRMGDRVRLDGGQISRV